MLLHGFVRLLDETTTPDVYNVQPDPLHNQQLHPRRRHAAELHAGDHQGLVQEHLTRSSSKCASTPTIWITPYDVILFINGVQCVLDINPEKLLNCAMEQVDLA